MGPREHLTQIVRPNMDDLHTNYGDVRYAFNGVAAVDALAGHVYRWCCSSAPHEVTGVRDDSAYRERLAQTNADFALVRDIAKAQKHVHLIYGSPQVSTAAQVETRSLGGMRLDGMRDDGTARLRSWWKRMRAESAWWKRSLGGPSAFWKPR